MKILITGVAGFVGSHLVDYVIQQHPKTEIFGLERAGVATDNLSATSQHVHIYTGDLTDADFVEGVITEVKPEKIFHLAAQSVVQASWGAASQTLSNNIVGQCNIFEVIRKLRDQNPGYDPVIQIAGSSEEYGLVKPEEVPITENNPLRPLSPYAVSKIAGDFLGYQYHQSYGLKIIRTRAFNHSGPRRPSNYVDSGMAKQISDIEKGIQPPIIEVGNLEAIRDFSDVRDIVVAYWLATEKAIPGEVYNIGSGHGYAIKEILDSLLSKSTKKNIEIRKDPKRMRPSDVSISVGNPNKFKIQTGWKPKFSYLEQTLPDMLDYWRRR